jgi:hypothetical protein
MRHFLRRRHQAAKHDEWFRAKVQEALQDRRPGIPHDVVMDEARSIIDRIAAEKATVRD